MAMSPDEPAMNIAANVRRLRRERGWKQEEAAEVMRQHGGPDLSKASWSALERSFTGIRVRSFTAHEIAVLAEMFEVPIGDLFTPQPVPCPRCGGKGELPVSGLRDDEREQLAEDES